MLAVLLHKFPHQIRAMPARDRDELIAFFELHPLPNPTWDAAHICATIANVNRSKGGRTFRPEDFMPRPIAGNKPQSTEEMMKVMDMVRGAE